MVRSSFVLFAAKSYFHTNDTFCVNLTYICHIKVVQRSRKTDESPIMIDFSRSPAPSNVTTIDPVSSSEISDNSGNRASDAPLGVAQ